MLFLYYHTKAHLLIVYSYKMQFTFMTFSINFPVFRPLNRKSAAKHKGLCGTYTPFCTVLSNYFSFSLSFRVTALTEHTTTVHTAKYTAKNTAVNTKTTTGSKGIQSLMR